MDWMWIEWDPAWKYSHERLELSAEDTARVALDMFRESISVQQVVSE